MAKIPELDKPVIVRPWWMLAVVTGQTTNARLPLSHLGGLPRGPIALSLANFSADTGSTTDADPGGGGLRWNNALQDAATVIFIGDADSDAGDHSGLWAAISAGARLYLNNPADLDVWQEWQIDSVVDAAGYAKLSVSGYVGAGSFADDDVVVLTIQQPALSAAAAEDVSYDNTTSGLAAGTVQAAVDELKTLVGGSGAGVSIGVQYQADTSSTADSDPGAGKLRWSHATQASATRLFLDDNSVDGASLTGFWAALVAGGFVYLQDAADQNAWQIWLVTSVSDVSGYVKFGVTLLANGDPITASAAILVTIEQGASGGGLTGFTSSLKTASPNNGTNASLLLASGGTTNQDAVVQPKGTGAFQTQLADGTATGGNKRGTGSTDTQMQRGVNTQVASGTRSALISGDSNQASAAFSGCFVGDSNTVSGESSVALGGKVIAISGDFSAGVGGQSITISGHYAANIGGYGITLTGQYSVGIGSYSDDLGLAGSFVQGSALFGGNWAGRNNVVMVSDTTDATPELLSTDNSPAGANKITLPNNSAFSVTGELVVRENATGDCARYDFKCLIRRGANAAATAIVGAPTVTQTFGDSGAATWVVALTADTTNGRLAITVTGEAAHTLRWGGKVEYVKVVG